MSVINIVNHYNSTRKGEIENDYFKLNCKTIGIRGFQRRSPEQRIGSP